MKRRLFTLTVLLISSFGLLPAATQEKKAAPNPASRASGKVQTPPPTKPPLQPVDMTTHPEGVERLDLFLLVGQSNMKGRGIMPDEPKRDPRIVMMHMKDGRWFLARHPLHLVGDPQTFRGADNAGVGPGLAFAEVLVSRDPKARIGLIPCAVGGTSIDLWQRGARLYDEAVRRAALARESTAAVKGAIRGVLWLQGEADATEQRIAGYEEKLLQLVDHLRADLAMPDLIFIACTIGEMRTDRGDRREAEVNRILLSLPSKRPHTGCVDARDLKTHIGDFVHFDTAAQDDIGRRYGAEFIRLARLR